VPAGRAELVRTHDLGADPRIEAVREGVVDAAAAAGLADHLMPEPGREHPLVQSLARVAEGRLARLAFARGEAVERDGEVMYTGD
jgi:hypothetical protein